MAVLIGVLGRDRPEALRACLASLRRAGAPARVLVHLDAPEPEVRAVAEASGFEVITSERQIGVGGSINRLLAHREPGEDFLRIDGDTEMVTEGWLALMCEGLELFGAVCPVLRLWDGSWRRFSAGRQVVPVNVGQGAAALIRADVLKALGAFRAALPYSFEDSDWWRRMQAAGFRVAVDRRVVAAEAGPPVERDTWRIRRPSAAYREARLAFRAEAPVLHRTLVSA